MEMEGGQHTSLAQLRTSRYVHGPRDVLFSEWRNAFGPSVVSDRRTASALGRSAVVNIAGCPLAAAEIQLNSRGTGIGNGNASSSCLSYSCS